MNGVPRGEVERKKKKLNENGNDKVKRLRHTCLAPTLQTLAGTVVFIIANLLALWVIALPYFCNIIFIIIIIANTYHIIYYYYFDFFARVF